jgi:hypothetical protein
MADVSAVKERAGFSARLEQAFRKAGIGTLSFTALAREFNSRHNEEPVTVHAVRKWMIGEAIPSQEKLVVLAHWLAINPQWLRYGVMPEQAQSVCGFDTEAHVLLQDFATLDAEGKNAVQALVAVLLKVK